MPQKIYDIKPPEKAARKSKGKEESKKSKGFLAAAFAGLVFLFAVIYFFTFRVEIDIWPDTRGVEMTETFTVDIDEDGEADLKGTIFETDFLEEYKEFEATGYEDEDTRARGTLIVRNEHWGQNQFLVEGTRFRTEDGKVFRATDGFMVPGGTSGDPGETSIEVVAENPGSEYNIGASEFRLPGLQGATSYQGVTAYNENPMTGGALGERTIISTEDIETARETVINSLLGEGMTILREGRGDEFLMEDGQFNYRIEEESVSGSEGEAAEDFNVKIRASVEVFTFNEEEFRNLLADSILQEVEPLEEGGLESEKKVYEESVSYTYELRDINWTAGTANLEVDFAGEVYSDISRSRLIDRSGGDTRSQVEEFLEGMDFIREASVRFKPFGLGTIPDNEDRIRIRLNF